MNKPPHHHMGRYARTLFMAGLMVCSSLAGCIFEDGSSDEDQEVLAVFSFNPSKNIKVGDSVSFDASSSTPNDGSLTYRWNFDTEGSIDIDATGLTATWTFDEAKTYKVTLEVSDGSATSEQVRDLVVAPRAQKHQRPRLHSTRTMRTAKTRKSPKPAIFSYGFVPAIKAPPTGPSPKQPPFNWTPRRPIRGIPLRNTSPMTAMPGTWTSPRTRTTMATRKTTMIWWAPRSIGQIWHPENTKSASRSPTMSR